MNVKRRSSIHICYTLESEDWHTAITHQGTKAEQENTSVGEIVNAFSSISHEK